MNSIENNLIFAAGPVDFSMNSAHMNFGINRPIPPLVPALTVTEVVASLENGYTGPYRLISSASCPSKRYQPPTVLTQANNYPQPVPMTQPRSSAVRNANDYVYPTLPSVRDPVNVDGFAQSLKNFESQMDRMLSSNSAPAQSNSYSSPLVPAAAQSDNLYCSPLLNRIPTSAPAPAPASRNNFSSSLHRIPSSVPTPTAAPAQPVKRLSSPVRHILPSNPASVQAFEHFASMLRNTSAPNSNPAPAQSNQGQSSQLHYIPPSVPTPPESSFSTATTNTIPYRSLTNNSEIESLHSDDLEDILIDYDTPQYISEIILTAIEVTPYMLPGETRCPEEFVDQYETYADLLQLNDEQKRVVFARYAYRDDTMRFEALKFDNTYEDMKHNFLEMSYNKVVISSLDRIAK